MSKKTPLQAFNNLCGYLDYDTTDYMFNGGYEEDSKIIETALKEGDKQLETLKSMYGNLEKLLVKTNTEKEKYKKMVEIIKNEFLSDLFFNDEIQQIALEWGLIRITTRIKDREKYELLKEILK